METVYKSFQSNFASPNDDELTLLVLMPEYTGSHYSDVIMIPMASQITGVSIVNLTV